ncbi:MAG TPA: PAS domain-containing sensor histidine kinase, partial [Gammaproteobacteria bacterium]|nr:PAS domain-containing sensor histidine kinase [Gammaproteobacteria bacterium]
SIFTIYIPLADAEAPTPQKVVNRNIIGGHETVCIVEDNIQVRNLARLILKGAGYNVMEAFDGQDALDKFALYKDEIDLVIMDVVMPRMGGREVMNEMQTLRPDIKILFTSGYSESGIHTNFILEEGLEFIAKP